jgi:aryl-alcohol dehydrogenase-like predicted oxidoreductase
MYCAMRSQRLALGTVQFGMRYGVANRGGQVAAADARLILARARASGMDTLDTAAAYGASEATLGGIGVTDWIIVSKIPAVPADCADVRAWVRASVTATLERLRVPRLGGLLLHSPMQLRGPNGRAIHAALRQLREEGLAARIGISVYGPEELDALIGSFDIDLVQAPFNILDRRLATTGWLGKLRAAGIEVHVRSLFLQGLLLMKAAQRPQEFARWQGLWKLWDHWLTSSGVTAVQACVAFAATHPQVHRAVVGVDSLQQLEEILSALTVADIELPRELACEERDLIDPSRWRLRGAA